MLALRKRWLIGSRGATDITRGLAATATTFFGRRVCDRFA
jgi:hypothetical protein